MSMLRKDLYRMHHSETPPMLVGVEVVGRKTQIYVIRILFSSIADAIEAKDITMSNGMYS